MSTPSTAACLAALLVASCVAQRATAAAMPSAAVPSSSGAAAMPMPGALAAPIGGSGTAQQVAFLGTKAHAGAYRLVGANESAGVETTLGGLPAYLASPNLSKTAKKRGPAAAVLLYSDIFGFRGNGTRKIADRLAAEGYVAVMPDFFSGRSAGSSDPADRAFILSIPRSDVERGAAGVLAALRKKYPSIKKTGAYGYCWGGRYATVAAGDLAAKGAAADAAVAFHASLVAPAEFAAISRPLLFVNAAGDPLFNETLIAIARQAGARNAARSPPVAVEIKTFDGVRHGFAARSAPNDTVATAAAEGAFTAGLAFLRRHGVLP